MDEGVLGFSIIWGYIKSRRTYILWWYMLYRPAHLRHHVTNIVMLHLIIQSHCPEIDIGNFLKSLNKCRLYRASQMRHHATRNTMQHLCEMVHRDPETDSINLAILTIAYQVPINACNFLKKIDTYTVITCSQYTHSKRYKVITYSLLYLHTGLCWITSWRCPLKRSRDRLSKLKLCFDKCLPNTPFQFVWLLMWKKSASSASVHNG